MSAREQLFKLPFDQTVVLIEEWIATLPLHIQYQFVMREYIGHLLEELCVKIWDTQAESAVTRATAYLKLCGANEQHAHVFSHQALDSIWMVVVAYFPDMTFQELAAGRYVLDQDMFTLLVYLVRNPS